MLMRVVSDSECAAWDKNVNDGVTDVIFGKENAWKDAANNGAARRRTQWSRMVKIFVMFSERNEPTT